MWSYFWQRIPRPSSHSQSQSGDTSACHNNTSSKNEGWTRSKRNRMRALHPSRCCGWPRSALFIKAAVSLTAVIQEPLDGKPVEVKVRRRNKTLRSPHAECHDLALEISIQSRIFTPRDEFREVLLGYPVRDLCPALKRRTAKTPTPPKSIFEGPSSSRTLGMSSIIYVVLSSLGGNEHLSSLLKFGFDVLFGQEI